MEPLLLSLAAVGLLALAAIVWSLQLRRAVRLRTAALERAEQLLKHHVENSPLAVIEWDASFHVVRWTGQAEQVFGWRASEVLGRHPDEWGFVHPEDKPRVDAVMVKLMEGKEQRNHCSNRNYCKDRTVVDCEWYNSGSPAVEGQNRSILSVVLDVTARNAAERALRESEERMRLFLENAPAGLAIFDNRMRYLAVSKRWLQDYRLQDNVLNKCHYDIFPDLPERWKEAHRRGLAGEILKSEGDRFEYSDGTIQWLRWEVLPWHTASGAVGGVIIAAEDITARKEAEEALRKSQERLSLVVESAKLGTWDWDIASGQLNWSPRCLALFGLTEESPLDYQGFLQALHPSDRANVDAAVRRAIELHSDYNIEMRAVWPDGSLHWISSRGRAYYDEAGEAVRMSGVAIDIHTLKNVEAALRDARDQLARTNSELEMKVHERTAKLEEIIGELEGFSYSLIHDLRAPLRGMQAYATALEEESGEQLEPQMREYLRKIKVAASRMDQLIVDSLNYSRILRDEVPLAPVDVAKLLRGMVETYPNLQPPNAEISVELETLLVLGNEASLTQIFSNLLGNAVKFVAPGVKPRVRVWAQHGKACSGTSALPLKERAEKCVLLWIEDNGIGIARENQEKIFGMFQRLHLASDYPGTGIGLAIVRKSLDRIGGRIWLESEPGEGSRFCVELPLASVSPPAPPP